MKIYKIFKLFVLFMLIAGECVVSECYAKSNTVILITDPKILSIMVLDNHEPMVDLKNQKDIVLGPSPEIPNNTDYTMMRKTVYEKLLQAQKSLPNALRFCLYECYIKNV